jgi:hypothetical protein
MGEDKGDGEIKFAPLTPALSHKADKGRFLKESKKTA